MGAGDGLRASHVLALVGGVGAAALLERWWRCRQDASPATDVTKAAPSAPQCVVWLAEVTKDRWIHYLLRPATALGASEVVWIGPRKAKGELKGVTPYGRAMKREASVPLTNVASLADARRHATVDAGCPDIVVVGVALDSSSITSPAPGDACGATRCPPVRPLMSLDFASLRARGSDAPAAAAVVFLLAGPAGRLSPSEAAHCDVIATVLPSSRPVRLPASLAGPMDGKQEANDGLNVSALLAIALHQFAADTAASDSAVGGDAVRSDKFGTVTAVPRGLRPAAAA